MISYDAAMELMRREGAARPLSSEIIALEGIAGRICCDAVASPIANQPFDNAAMDGFALKSEDLAHAVNDNPVALDVLGRVAAGDAAPSKAPARGQCYEIMTGAPMPPGCDAVVPIEKTERRKKQAMFRQTADRSENVRHAGEDFTIGETVLERGQVLNEHHVLVLATLGIGQVKVLCRPKVAVLSTGAEVVDDLKAALGPGRIYNSTGPYMRSVLPAFGADAVLSGTIADEPESFRRKLSSMTERGVDLVVTTGAVSAGAHDFIRQELEKAGAEILFHKVKIRPGKPILFAKLPDRGPLFIGLPGNPVATAAGLRFFIYPLIRAMQGLAPEPPKQALLKNNYSNRQSDFRFFLRAVTRHTDKTTYEIEIQPKQQSFMVSPFVHANAWAVVSEGTETVKAGDMMGFYPLYPSPFSG